MSGNQSNWGAQKTLTCAHCGESFSGYTAKWCSHNCYGKWRKKNDPVYRKKRKQYERDWKYEWGKKNDNSKYLREKIKEIKDGNSLVSPHEDSQL